MRRLIFITLLLLLITPCLRGQRKEMSQARSYIKSGKDFDKAEKLMDELLAKDSANRMNPKIYMLLYQSVLKQYEAGNEKLYLNQKYDTASIFNLTRRMFAILESLDSIDALPDSKGRVRPEYRRKHAAELNTYRPNLYYGGTFHIHKSDYNTAYLFFDAYLDCGVQPLFSGYDYLTHDKRMSDAAYWATYCGYKLKEPEKTLKYSDLALQDTAKRKFVYVYMAEAYSQKKDNQKYIETLYDGFKRYPQSSYFFPHLLDYYTTANMLDSAFALTDKALETDGRNPLFLFAKSTVLLNQGKYDECIAISDSIIHINDSLPESYYNAGTAHLNKILSLEKKDNPRQYRFQIRKLYQQACPYMEKYRKLAPDNKQKWGPALYRIYLNLNMGKQFEEIDAQLNDKGQSARA